MWRGDTVTLWTQVAIFGARFEEKNIMAFRNCEAIFVGIWGLPFVVPIKREPICAVVDDQDAKDSTGLFEWEYKLVFRPNSCHFPMSKMRIITPRHFGTPFRSRREPINRFKHKICFKKPPKHGWDCDYERRNAHRAPGVEGIIGLCWGVPLRPFQRPHAIPWGRGTGIISCHSTEH